MKKLTEAQKLKAKTLNDKGYSVQEIAYRLGIEIDVINELLPCNSVVNLIGKYSLN